MIDLEQASEQEALYLDESILLLRSLGVGELLQLGVILLTAIRITLRALLQGRKELDGRL